MLRRTIRSSIVDLLLLAILVQDAFAPFPGYSKKSSTFSSNDDPNHPGPFHQKLAKLLQQNDTGKVPHTPPPGDPNTISSVFKQKFNKEMIFLFSFLDQQKQCHILNKVAKKVSCSISITTKIASNFTELWKGTRCPSKPVNRRCYVDNKLKLKVRKIFLKRLAKLFISLPLPFKCLIINSIASFSNYDTSQQQHTKKFKMTLKQAEQETEKLFTSVKLDSKCSKVTVKKNPPLMQAALVNITVQLYNITQIQWIKHFKKESPKIFFEYIANKTRMQQSSNPNRPVHANPFSKRRGSSNSLKKGSIRTDVRKVSKGKYGKFTLRFGIKVRSASGEYKNWGNGKDIARSLRNLHTKNERLKANILKIRKLKKKSPSKTELLSEKGEPLLAKDITVAMTLFPVFLKNYYKRIKLRHKCYVMWMIAETLNKKLNTVEHLYSTLERLSKKNFCSPSRPPKKHNVTNIIIMIANTVAPPITSGQPTLFPNLPVSLIPQLADSGKEETTEDKTTLEDGDGQASASTEKEITALEIALFTMLAFLCIAILAFTINCVIFAMKTRSYANSGANAATAINNTVLARAVFSRVSTNVPIVQSQNVSNTLWVCCLKHPQDSSLATSNRSTPQQPLNNPLRERSDERQLQMTPLQVDSCEDTKTSCPRTRTLQPVKSDSEELQVNHEIETATHSQTSCTAV